MKTTTGCEVVVSRVPRRLCGNVTEGGRQFCVVHSKPANASKFQGRACPACNGKLVETRVENVTVDRCKSCAGLISEGIYLGDSYTLVLPYFEQGPYEQDEVRYFDFVTLGSEGVSRRHGWYLPRTRKVVQIG